MCGGDKSQTASEREKARVRYNDRGAGRWSEDNPGIEDVDKDVQLHFVNDLSMVFVPLLHRASVSGEVGTDKAKCAVVEGHPHAHGSLVADDPHDTRTDLMEYERRRGERKQDIEGGNEHSAERTSTIQRRRKGSINHNHCPARVSPKCA